MNARMNAIMSALIPNWHAPRINRLLQRPVIKPLVFALATMPLAWLLLGTWLNTLGANPAEAIMRGTGDWALRLLWLTLTITPLRQLTGWHALARLRRMLGLFTFAYAVLHFLCFAWMDMGFDLDAILRDIAKRPFILVGTAAFLGLIPLAATSFNGAVRAMGAARWQALHRVVYAVSLLALLHFYWMRLGKNDTFEVAVYGVILIALLGWRWLHRRRHGSAGAH